MRKLIFILTLALVSLSANAQGKIKWLSFEEAIALNAKTPKPILIDVYTDWCGFCKKMDIETYSNKTIIKIINDNFYAIKLNGEEKKDITYNGHTFKFQKNGRRGFHQLPATIMNGKLSYPSTIFLSEKEELLQNIPGYQQKEMFEKILVYFSSDNYKNTSWKDFDKEFKSSL
ncbi:thioredoxin family protein [Polaribacter sp. OB-PA-B3]